MKTISANGFAVTPALARMALTQSGVSWAISPEQHQSIENFAITNPVEISKTIKEGEERITVLPIVQLLAGIPSTLDRNLPPGVIELRLRDEVLVRIESLGIPAGMYRSAVPSNRPPFETFKGAICRGCYTLGTACGTCEKCLWERAQMNS